MPRSAALPRTRTCRGIPPARSILGLLVAALTLLALPAWAGDGVRRVRQIEAGELGVSGPRGVAWSRRADALLVATASGLEARDRDAPGVGPRRTLGLGFADPGLVAFDNVHQRLVAWDAKTERLVLVPAGPDGLPVPGRREVVPARHFGIGAAAGLAVDPVSGRIVLLDAAGPRLVVVEPDAEGRVSGASLTEQPLAIADAVRGLAVDPTTGQVHVLAPAAGRLYAVDAAGTLVANRDVAELGLRAPEAMVFAPSGDGTDDPAQQSLYVVEAGATTAGATGGIAELSLATATAAPAAPVTTVQAVLVRRVHTSQYDPPSPDSMGIAYLDGTDTLLLSDSELNEINSLFTGDNLFEIDYRDGSLLGTASTLEPQDYSTEPTGVAYDPVTNTVFIGQDDGGSKLFVVQAGNDGFFFTDDDDVREVSTGSFGNGDNEGITFDRNRRVVCSSDGVDSEVYCLDPGNDGTYGTGDDSVSHFDTASHGVSDPEGIAYDPFSGNLYVGGGNPEDTVLELSPQGQLVRVIDISDANPPNPSGLTYGPGSQNPSVYSLYITDRGTDNDSVSWPNPGENDGQLFEVSFNSAAPGNDPPQVDAGPDQAITLPDEAFLDATVTDDPSQILSYQWSKVSGPGSVGFGSPNAEDTTASFGSAGSYVLQLVANDGQLVGSDQVGVTVAGVGGATVLEVRVAAGSDDAEEEVGSGSMDLNSSDLELIEESTDQIVGMRFTGLAIPPGASITDAWIQFQVDETDSVATALTFRGQRIGNAPTFSSSSGNISSRTPTAAFTSWSPPAWTQTGQAGSAQRTPSVAGIVGEIVGLPGWSSGNAMVFLVTGSGTRTAESFNGDSSGAPLLHVEFSTGANDPPSVTLSQPSNGASFDEGQTIGFSGSASDSEDGSLTGDLAWSSSLDGPIGSGGSFSRSDLTPGTHTITASVTDSGGKSDSVQVQITVVATNTPPGVQITAPANGSSFSVGTSVAFNGSATDAEDGSLSGSLAWSSNLDGAIGSGASFSTSSLSAGSHTITASVTDSGGLGGSDSISVIVDALGVPTVAITAPSDGFSINLGEAVTLSATASDPENGNLSGSITWSSSEDGGLGSGASISASGLSAGTHTITASATDLDGNTGSDSITLLVNTGPSLSIVSPASGSQVNEGQTVTLSGTASDPDQGDLSGSIAWSSDLDGSLGSGSSVSTSGLSAGTHLITAAVADSAGLGADDSITLVVNGAPSLSITAPSDGAVVSESTPVTFSATALDPEQGDVGGGVSWSSSKEGDLGTGASITVSLSSRGRHQITATVTDSNGAEASASISVRVSH